MCFRVFVCVCVCGWMDGETIYECRVDYNDKSERIWARAKGLWVLAKILWIEFNFFWVLGKRLRVLTKRAWAATTTDVFGLNFAGHMRYRRI